MRINRAATFQHPKYPLVAVKWLDHAGGGAQVRSFEELRCDLTIVYTIGWQVKETKDAILLVATITNDDGFADDCCIAKKLIVFQKVLLPPKLAP